MMDPSREIASYILTLKWKNTIDSKLSGKGNLKKIKRFDQKQYVL